MARQIIGGQMRAEPLNANFEELYELVGEQGDKLTGIGEFQDGMVTILSTGIGTHSNTVTFPAAFTGIPRVVATIRGNNPVAVSVSNVTSSGATIYIKDDTTGVKGFDINWMARRD